MIYAGTHYAQWASILLACVIDVGGLLFINRMKQKEGSTPPKLSWTAKRNAYWVLVSFLIAWATILDAYFPIDTRIILYVKFYALSFPLSLLDLYFSDTKGVSPSVLIGASIYCSCDVLRHYLVDLYLYDGQHVPLHILKDFSFLTLLKELPRFAIFLASIGLLSDLCFSPTHRLWHRFCFDDNHKKHHEFTQKLTSPLIYYGTVLDVLFMAFSAVTMGSFWYYVLAFRFFPHCHPSSNLGTFLLILNSHLSHAHDIRCAGIIAPLPDSMNFVAYHYVHHLYPTNNYGLTEPTDMLWDWILGVRTIRKLDNQDKRE